MDLIVAVTADWGIGYKGTQPLVVSADRKRFREITQGGAVLVGRRTLQDFPGGKPLKNRRNIVLSGDAELQIPGAEVAHSLEEALALAAEAQQVFVIGGASVYRQFLPYCQKAYVTKIDALPPSDTFFPDLDALDGWRLAEVEGEGTQDGVTYRFLRYENSADPEGGAR